MYWILDLCFKVVKLTNNNKIIYCCYYILCKGNSINNYKIIHTIQCTDVNLYPQNCKKSKTKQRVTSKTLKIFYCVCDFHFIWIICAFDTDSPDTIWGAVVDTAVFTRYRVVIATWTWCEELAQNVLSLMESHQTHTS